MNLFGGRSTASSIIALDIGDQFVKAIECQTDQKTGNITITGIGKNRLTKGWVSSGIIQNQEAVFEVCQNTLIEASQVASIAEHSLFLGAPGVVVEEHLLEFYYRRDQPLKKVNHKEFEHIMTQIEQFLDKKHTETAAQFIQKMDIIQSSIVSLQIDNKKVDELKGQPGSDIVVLLFVCYGPERYVQQLEALSEYLGVSIEGVFSQHYCVSELVSEMSQNTTHFISIDIGSLNTSLFLTLHNTIRASETFGIGGVHFSQKIGRGLKMSEHEAETLKIHYSKSELPKKMSLELFDLLNPDINLWISGLTISLKEMLADIDFLPSEIILYGGGCDLLGIKEALEYNRWYESLPFIRKPHISFLKPKDFPHIVDTTGHLNSPDYINVISLAHVGARVGQESDIKDHISSLYR